MTTFSRQLHARASADPFFHRDISIIFYYRDVNQGVESIKLADPLTFSPYDEAKATSRPTPTIALPPDAAQELIDELWRAGLRPTEGHGSAGQLAAVSRHLEDMRALVFKTEKP